MPRAGSTTTAADLEPTRTPGTRATGAAPLAVCGTHRAALLAEDRDRLLLVRDSAAAADYGMAPTD